MTIERILAVTRTSDNPAPISGDYCNGIVHCWLSFLNVTDS